MEFKICQSSLLHCVIDFFLYLIKFLGLCNKLKHIYSQSYLPKMRRTEVAFTVSVKAICLAGTFRGVIFTGDREGVIASHLYFKMSLFISVAV